MCKWISIGIFLFMSTLIFSQTTVFGYVKGDKGKSLENVDVIIQPGGQSVKTDKVGYFQFVDLTPGRYKIYLDKDTYEDYVIENVIVSDQQKIDLGIIQMEYNPAAIEIGLVTLGDDVLGDDTSSSQTGVGILQASRDLFTRVSSFEFGFFRFNQRGYDNRFRDVLFNGIPMTKHGFGRVDFSNWGGLNDITRFPYELVYNHAPSDYTFGDVGGVTYFNTRASNYRKGTSIAYSLTNRNYNNRVMVTHSTGMLPSGWALTISGSRRWAEEGIIEGTYFDGYGYFLSLEKRLGDKHSINLTTFGSPTRSTQGSPNTREVVNLRGVRYNSYWGWLNGEKRNERVREVFEPITMLTHYWNIGKSTKVINTLSYQFGRDGRGRLDWYNAPNPSPTYYRNLPSWLLAQNVVNQQAVDEMYDRWQNDPSWYQINWEALYLANLNANITNSPAVYFLVQDRVEDKTWNVNSHLDTRLSDQIKFYANVNYQNLVSDNYRAATDLLGGNYILDRDAFAQPGFSGNFNELTPNRTAGVDERIRYSYKFYREQLSVNTVTQLTLPRWDVGISTLFGYTEAQREGDFQHYLYPTNSLGKSELKNFIDIGIKAEVTYKINGRNFITAASMFSSVAPTLNEIFSDARLNNFITPNITTLKIFSNDLSYIWRSPVIKMRATGYYTRFDDAIEISRYFAEGLDLGVPNQSSSDAFVSEILTDVSKRHIGLEFAAEVKLSSTLTTNLVASIGDFTYDNNPRAYLTSDVIAGVRDFGIASMDGYKVSGSPQKAVSVGFQYRSPKFWWVGLSGNYLADNYLDISPILRTQNFVIDPVSGQPYPGATEENVRAALRQEKFSGEYMVNANAGKSWRIGSYTLGLSVSVNNLLNNTNYITGGFEQARKANYPEFVQDQQRAIPVFGPRYWFALGTSYFINAYLRF